MLISVLPGIMPHIRHASRIWLAEMWTEARQAVREPLFAASILFAVITVAGAFGTFRSVLPLRLMYWILMTFCAAGFLLAIDRSLGRTLIRGWAVSVATVLVTAVPVALFSTAAGTVLLPEEQTFAWRFLQFYPGALVLNILLLALWRLTKTPNVIVEAATTGLRADTVPPRIASKLPPRKARSRLLAVEAQDHYPRVATRDGDALVYMRFSDALEAFEQSNGVRVRRSWWVARTSIELMKFASGRGELTLVNGAVVPVSRRFASEVKAMARRSTP